MTDKHIPASKLLALKDYWDERMGCMTVRSEDLRALIETEPESVEPVEYQIKILAGRWTHCAKHLYDPANPNTRALYADPQNNLKGVDE